MSLSQVPVKKTRKRLFSFLQVMTAGMVVVVIIIVGGLAYAGKQEEEDSFCASCHTQPEVTYYQRSISQKNVDLASVHPTTSGCIDCHSGKGTVGRVVAEFIGARNAIKWILGIAVQPAVITFAIRDENCLECHKLIIEPGFSPQERIVTPVGSNAGSGEGKANHWHSSLARWQSSSAASAGGCVSCHSGHTTDSNAQNGFMNPGKVLQTCNACHLALKVKIK